MWEWEYTKKNCLKDFQIQKMVIEDMLEVQTFHGALSVLCIDAQTQRKHMLPRTEQYVLFKSTCSGDNLCKIVDLQKTVW